jgi:hypothetical protein
MMIAAKAMILRSISLPDPRSVVLEHHRSLIPSLSISRIDASKI